MNVKKYYLGEFVELGGLALFLIGNLTLLIWLWSTHPTSDMPALILSIGTFTALICIFRMTVIVRILLRLRRTAAAVPQPKRTSQPTQHVVKAPKPTGSVSWSEKVRREEQLSREDNAEERRKARIAARFDEADANVRRSREEEEKRRRNALTRGNTRRK
ncbi:hypothetical protein [Sphingomonas sp. 3-13AW]|uniref:hypothetical protein n=1 Tax=Sphingomonas sp. 3-13AW TaxID=3050450 RepID=UPI003BB54DC7